MKLKIISAVALIDIDSKVLIAKRPMNKHYGGYWEFPGGKLKKNETPEIALIRELNEEINIDVTESCLAPSSFSSYNYEQFHLLITLFICRKWKGSPNSNEGQKLKWINKNDFFKFEMPPANKTLLTFLRDLI